MHHFVMPRPAEPTSNRSFFVRLSIDQLPRRLDFTAEERVSNALFRDQVHPSPEQALHGLREVQEPVRVCTVRETVGRGDDEVDVAGRLEAS